MDLQLPPENFDSPLLQEAQEVILENGSVDEIVDLHTSATIISYIAANDPENIKANTNLATLVFLEDINVDLTSLTKPCRGKSHAVIFDSAVGCAVRLSFFANTMLYYYQ